MEKYQLQLEQVNASLVKDPQNSTLQALKGKLEQLISLTTGNTTKSPLAPSISTSSNLQVGESCEAFLKELSVWKLGRILSVPVSEDGFIIVEIESDKTTRRLECKNVRRPRERQVKRKLPAASSTTVAVPKPAVVRKKQQQQELAGAVEWKKFSQKLNKKP